MSDERLAFPREELRPRTVRGAVVNAVFMGGGELLVLVQGLILTVLLGPENVGLYGIVTTTAMTVVALKRIGIDEAFVQQSEADQEKEFQRAFTLELIAGAGFTTVLLVAAPLVTVAYGDGRLLALMFAVSYMPLAFALQAPTWIFFRQMDFVRVRTLQTLVPAVNFCVTVPLAAVGVGVWSPVIGAFAGSVVAVVAGVAVSPYKLRLRFDAAARRRYLRFSWPVAASSFALLIVQQGQILAFSLHSGVAAAGFITLAQTLTRYADRADQIIATTIYPAICVVRDRIATLEEIFAKSNRVALIWVLPFCTGFILFAPDLVRFVLGHKWHAAIVLVQGLAAAAAVQQLGYNWFSFYRARGDSARQAVEGAVMTVTFLGLALPGLVLWGSWGYVGGRIAGAVIVLGVRRYYVRRLLPRIELLRLAVRGGVPVVAGVGVALALRYGAWPSHRALAEAVVELVGFLAATAVATWFAERDLLRELVAQVRMRRTPVAPVAPATAEPVTIDAP